jgi:hypothetical protein
MPRCRRRRSIDSRTEKFRNYGAMRSRPWRNARDIQINSSRNLSTRRA